MVPGLACVQKRRKRCTRTNMKEAAFTKEDWTCHLKKKQTSEEK